MPKAKKTVSFLDTPPLPVLGAIRKKHPPKKKKPEERKITKAPTKEKIEKTIKKAQKKKTAKPKTMKQNITNHAHKHHTQEKHEHPKEEIPSFDPNKPIEQQLTENLVALQKVNVHLAEKFDKMEKQLSELLSLFEMAARSLAKQPENQTSQKDREFLNKIDRLLEQNKTIAKGLTLMEDHVRSRIQEKPITPHQEPEARPPIGRPLPRF